MLRQCRLILALILLCLWGQTSFAAIVMGNPHGSVTLDFVYDYQCVHCHKVYPEILSLMDEYPDLKVRMLPVAILGHNSLIQASAAITAASHSAQDFEGLTSIWMMQNPANFKQIQTSLVTFGLTSQASQQQMHSDMVKVQLDEGMQTLGRDGTPVVQIYASNTPEQVTRLVGEQSLSVYQKAINHDQ